MNNEDRIKCYELMREYGLKCSEFLFGHGWHMSDVPKEQWFVFITSEDIDYIRIATTVQIHPPVKRSRNEYEKTWHIATTNTDSVNTYKDFKYVLDYLIDEYMNQSPTRWVIFRARIIKCKKELRELLIREAANGNETQIC